MNRLSKSIVAILATLSVSTLLGGTASAKGFDGALGWIPADVSTLVAVDLDGARKTSFFKDVQKQIIDLTGYGRDIAQMKRDGIDVMATVKTIVYGGPDEVVRKANQSLVVLEGDFDQAKIKSYYEKKGKAALSEKTHALGPYFEVGGDACIMINGGFLVFGSKALFEKALAAKKANEGGKNAKVHGLVQRFKGGKHGFGVITGSDQLKKILGKDFGDVKDVKSAAMTFDFSSGFGLEIVGIFGDASQATNVANAVKKELGELAADPEMKEIGLEAPLGKVTAAATGPEVKIALALDAAGAASFAKSLKDLF